MKGLQKLAPLLNVHPGEGRLVAVLLAHSLCAGLGQTLTQTAGFSLFLSEFSIRLLPFVYFGVTVAAVTVTLVMLHLQRRVSFSSLMLGAVGLIVEVVRGIIHVLSEFVRERAADVAGLRAQMTELDGLKPGTAHAPSKPTR